MASLCRVILVLGGAILLLQICITLVLSQSEKGDRERESREMLFQGERSQSPPSLLASSSPSTALPSTTPSFSPSPIVPYTDLNPLLRSHSMRTGEEAVGPGFTPVPMLIEETQDQTAKACPSQAPYMLLPGLPVPDFCLIGVAKGGTTSFSQYIGMYSQTDW